MSSSEKIVSLIVVITILFCLCGCSDNGNATDNAVLSPGDVLLFGHFDYDSIAENSSEPIQWIVLEIDGDDALLLSRYGLWADAMDPNGSWEFCSMREYLNDWFMMNAFNSGERDCIHLSSIETKKAPTTYRDESSVLTEDYVFLLSYDEVIHYLPEEQQRLVRPTVSAIKKGAGTNSDYYGWWWLRTPSIYVKSDYFTYVDSHGEVKYYVDFVDVRDASIRPAIWVNLNQAGKLITKTEHTDTFLPHKDNDSIIGTWVFTDNVKEGYTFDLLGNVEYKLIEGLEAFKLISKTTYSAENEVLKMKSNIAGLRFDVEYPYLRYGDFLIMGNDILAKQALANHSTVLSNTTKNDSHTQVHPKSTAMPVHAILCPLIIQQPKSVSIQFADKYDAYEGKKVTFDILADNVAQYEWEYSKDNTNWQSASVLDVADQSSVYTEELAVTISNAEKLQFRCKMIGTDDIVLYSNTVELTTTIK